MSFSTLAVGPTIHYSFEKETKRLEEGPLFQSYPYIFELITSCHFLIVSNYFISDGSFVIYGLHKGKVGVNQGKFNYLLLEPPTLCLLPVFPNILLLLS